MTGLVLLLLGGAWLFAIYWVVKRVLARKELRGWRFPAAAALAVAMLPLPLADELVGAVQHRSLCREAGPKESVFASSRGLSLTPQVTGPTIVNGQLLETKGYRWILSDPQSSVDRIAFMDYRVTGGWLITALRISETNKPLIFRGSCWGLGTESFQGWLDRYQITLRSSKS
jgi:hypothetical protein